MKILEDNARRGNLFKGSLKVRCPYYDSILLVEEGDCRKKYEWESAIGKSRKYYYYITDYPCCKEEFKVNDNENIRTTKNSRAL